MQSKQSQVLWILSILGAFPPYLFFFLAHHPVAAIPHSFLALAYMISYYFFIISFIAGIYWGIALVSNQDMNSMFIVSAGFVLVGFLGYFFLHATGTNFLVVLLLACLWLMDFDLYKKSFTTKTYFKLRTVCTALMLLPIIYLILMRHHVL
jgi:hypothetical protein